MLLKHLFFTNLFIFLVTFLIPVYSQSLPLEMVAGHRYLGFQVNVDKKFSDSSRWSFYHTNTMKVNYENKASNEFMMLNFIQFRVVNTFKLIAGTYYGQPGFKPTTGIGYSFKFHDFSLAATGRISLIAHPDWEYFLNLQYRPVISGKLRFYSRIQMRSAFNASGHIKGYQWFRVGLDTGGVQFGAAGNLDEYGPTAILKYNFGIFIRKEL